MKKVLIAILTIATLASCNKDDVTHAGSKGHAISFDTITTRANTTLSDITGFKVYAQESKEVGDYTQTQGEVEYEHILDAEEVTRPNNTSNEWTYENTQYWVNGLTYHFFAVYPVDLDTEIYQDGYQLTYSTPVEANEDPLYAYYSEYIEPDQVDFDPVSFRFGHILSKVRLEIKQDMVKNQYDKFYVKSIQLSNVKKSGVLTTSPYNHTGSWYFDNSKLSFLNNYVEEVNKLGYELGADKTLKPWGEDGDGLHLIPQPIGLKEMELVIEYVYVQGDKDGNLSAPEDKTIRTSIPAGEWQPGITYTYNAVLYQDNLIVFKNIAVEEWGEPLTGGTIIIK